ncbi:uncharacterized protein LOC142097048 [Mixophyes fleayi]|uniref:uncharacterized protein LOC142097048 n=1 Tax=Mixophyes fleayi TaxID=3061075 RepID=UPI003F4DFC3B
MVIQQNVTSVSVLFFTGNFMPLNRVEWKNNYNDMMELVEESEMDPNYTDFIVPVFVFSVKAGLAEEKMPEVKIFMDNCREMTGIVPIVVLTNKTSGNYFMTDRQFKDMGAETVISVENYTKEKNIKTLGNSTEFLMFIDSAIKEVQLHMQQIRDPIAERVDRKTFVLKYIHDAEETKAKAELQRQQDRLERKRRDTKRREREVREEMEEMEREQRKKKRKRPWWKFCDEDDDVVQVADSDEGDDVVQVADSDEGDDVVQVADSDEGDDVVHVDHSGTEASPVTIVKYKL